LAFFCPKAGEELLLRGSSSGRSSSSSGRSSSSRSSSGSSSRSGGGSSGRRGGGSSGRRGGGSRSSISGLRRFSSGLRRFDFGRLGRLRGFGFATCGHSQGEEGSYEERLLHMSEFLNVMELRGQLVDRNVSISIGAHVITPGEICGAVQQSGNRQSPVYRVKARSY
jgi:hypothetical protein